jgi:hypothetical protein
VQGLLAAKAAAWECFGEQGVDALLLPYLSGWQWNGNHVEYLLALRLAYPEVRWQCLPELTLSCMVTSLHFLDGTLPGQFGN